MSATTPAQHSAAPIDISQALADYRAWLREEGYDGDEPPVFWGGIEQEGYPHGVDVNIELDEDSGQYAAWVYPNRIGAGGWLETDTQTLLAVIPSTEWPP